MHKRKICDVTVHIAEWIVVVMIFSIMACIQKEFDRNLQQNIKQQRPAMAVGMGI